MKKFPGGKSKTRLLAVLALVFLAAGVLAAALYVQTQSGSNNPSPNPSQSSSSSPSVSPSPSPTVVNPSPSPSPNPSPSPKLIAISASSVQNAPGAPGQMLLPDLAFDGNFKTRWASSPNDPWASIPNDPEPWLELDYDLPQELSTIQIYFERAYATKYNITTWDGDSWVTQITVENNTFPKPENPPKYNTFLTPTYQFPQGTQTTKLRINFIDAWKYPYGLVSIWEIVINPQSRQ